MSLKTKHFSVFSHLQHVLFLLIGVFLEREHKLIDSLNCVLLRPLIVNGLVFKLG